MTLRTPSAWWIKRQQNLTKPPESSPALTKLSTAVAALGLTLPEDAFPRFQRFLSELMYWRTRLNLIGAATEEEVVARHFIDSLLPLAVVQFPRGSRVADVGTGAGLPGIPISIARPDLRMTLIEASRRKVAFLELMRRELGLEGVHVQWGRAELLARDERWRERYEVVITRAVARLDVSAELSLPFVTPGGCAIVLKGPNVEVERFKAKGLIEALGATIEHGVLRHLPESDRTRAVIVLRKVRTTDLTFPRTRRRLGAPPDV